MNESHPVYKIEDVYQIEKYDTPTNRSFSTWVWIQLLAQLGFIVYLFGNIAYLNDLNPSYIYLYGLFIFLSVQALTELMDMNRNAWIWELIRAAFGAGILYWQGDWFGLSERISWMPILIGAYLLMSLATTIYFSNPLKRGKQS